MAGTNLSSPLWLAGGEVHIWFAFAQAFEAKAKSWKYSFLERKLAEPN
ncbi:hypothetical protein C2W64_00341 [Brevibacillus laterosporus]|nr:hypothetical protein [Brevibacillus laterosporus]RAP31169.1 hypothetical protein C2W64_00341 [Brevibacillus laterosporus]